MIHHMAESLAGVQACIRVRAVAASQTCTLHKGTQALEIPLNFRARSPQTVTAACSCQHRQHRTALHAPRPPAAAVLPLAGAACTAPLLRHQVVPGRTAQSPRGPSLCCASTRRPAALTHCLCCTGVPAGCCCCTRLLQTRGAARGRHSTCDMVTTVTVIESRSSGSDRSCSRCRY